MRAAIALGLLSLFLGSANAYVLRLSPSAQTVGQGSQASVVLRVEDAGLSGLGAYDFDLLFDASILSYSGFLDAGNLGLAIGLGVTVQAGQLTLSDFSLETIPDLLALQTDSFDLLTLFFDAIAPGTSALTMSNVSLGDAAGTVVAVETFGANITVTGRALPEPGSLVLASLALVCGGLFGRCARHAARSLQAAGAEKPI